MSDCLINGIVFESESETLTSVFCCDIEEIEEVDEAEEEDDDEVGEGNDDIEEADEVDESISFSLPLYLVFVVFGFGKGYVLLTAFMI